MPCFYKAINNTCTKLSLIGFVLFTRQVNELTKLHVNHMLSNAGDTAPDSWLGKCIVFVVKLGRNFLLLIAYQYNCVQN